MDHLSNLYLVKGRTDANILLSQCDGEDGIRILIGGWQNRKSVIRRTDGGANIVETKHSPLSETEFREGFKFKNKLA